MDTIFALSSGQAPAAIAVIRVSGPLSGAALKTLAGEMPPARHARLATLQDSDGAVLDRALLLWFPGPATATGEDMAEFHLHGGRAVIAAVEAALGALPGLRRAEPGEFTRRAFVNGRIDLAEAEGLADLLAAETELQRRAAMEQAGGAFSRRIDGWRERLLGLSARLEASLDFEDEADVAAIPEGFLFEIRELADEVGLLLAAPSAEALREGYRVVIAGPPNAGKSTLFNALVEDEAAITTPLAGTTRDVLVRPVALAGIPFSFVDTAGLREDAGNEVEAIGIAKASGELAKADLVLWLGDEGKGSLDAWEIEAQLDRPDHARKVDPRYRLSAVTGQGMDELRQALVARAALAMPGPGEAAVNARQRARIAEAHAAMAAIEPGMDHLLVAEQLRLARVAFDRLTGLATTEDMLNALFGRFCIGK